MGVDAADEYREAVEAVVDLAADLAEERPHFHHQVGSWRVFPLAFGQAGYPRALVILPEPSASAVQVQYGITTGVLRTTPLAEIAASHRSHRIMRRDYTGLLTGPALAGGPRHGGNRYYAYLAAAYVQLTEDGETQPLKKIARDLGINTDTLRTQLRVARQRGLLTAVPGRPAGHLTDKARDILAESPPGSTR